MPTLSDITIRTDLRQGDLAAIMSLHARVYGPEFGYNLYFEAMVAKSLHEFYESYKPDRSRIWLCEHNGKLIGSLALLDRGDAAQLRYFVLDAAYRGIGLGSKLMNHYMEFLSSIGFTSSYLLTTDDLGDAARLYTKHGFKLVSNTGSDAYGDMLHKQRYELHTENA